MALWFSSDLALASEIFCPRKRNAKAGTFNISVINEDVEEDDNSGDGKDVEKDEEEDDDEHEVHAVEVAVHVEVDDVELEHISLFSSYAGGTSSSSSEAADDSSELYGSSSGVFGICHVRGTVSSLMIFLILRPSSFVICASCMKK